MSTRSDLASLGWNGAGVTTAQMIRGFQRGWNLGPALVEDGSDGPKTRTAIKISLDRKAKGLPDFSANFSAKEFRCHCGEGGRAIAEDCQRIWIQRSTVQMAEKFRARVGPFTPERACRCRRSSGPGSWAALSATDRRPSTP